MAHTIYGMNHKIRSILLAQSSAAYIEISRTHFLYTIYGIVHTKYSMNHTIYGMTHTIYGMIHTIYGMV